MNDDTDFFAPPPFKAAEALATLKRGLRELKLTERAGRFELNAQPVVTLVLEEGAIQARLVKRPAQSPEWTSRVLKSSADVRRFSDDVKQQLARWSDRDD